MIDKNKHDITRIFNVYTVLVGDVEKTAMALDLVPADVAQLAESEGWVEKIKRLSVLSKTGTPGDWERAQNRALNFVQAHQLRRSIDGVIAHLCTLDPEQVITTKDGQGNTKFSARLLSDLAKSMQTIHEVTYAALGDSARERSDRQMGNPAGDPTSANGLHAALISALNTSSLTNKPAEELVKEAVAKALEHPPTQ